MQTSDELCDSNFAGSFFSALRTMLVLMRSKELYVCTMTMEDK